MNNLNAPRQFTSGLGIVLVLCLFAVGAYLFYWVALRSDMLLNEDNPRLVEAELRIQRGDIRDTRGNVLAESVGPDSRLERDYPFSAIGPAVGYYSLVHGTAGIEEGLDAVLRGTTDDFWQAWWRDLLHEPQVGSNVRMTLDQGWQDLAEQALGDNKGAVILLSLTDNAVRAMVSHPTYDPNLLEEQFDALSADPDSPLLNRATQGQYQPGMLLQPFVLAGALERELITLDQPVDGAADALVLDNRVFQCAAVPGANVTWLDVLQNSCPGPTYRLGQTLQADQLTQIVAGFGLTLTPTLPIATAGPVFAPIERPGLAAIGQENLAITPLQAILAWAALLKDGVLSGGKLLGAIQAPGQEWQVAEPEFQAQSIRRAVDTASADQIVSGLSRPNGFLEHSATALSGPEGESTAWYLGAAPGGQPTFAVVVVLEDGSDPAVAQEIGRNVLDAVLAPRE